MVDIYKLHALPTPTIECPRHKGPPNVSHHTASIIEDTIFIVGGYLGGTYFNDVYMLDIHKKSLSWSKPTVRGVQLPPLAHHTATTIGNKVYLFGGKNESQIFNSVYVFNSSTLSWSECASTQAPSARYGHTTDRLSDTELIVFGGTDGKAHFNDVHIFDVETLEWRKRETFNSPSPRYFHATMLAHKRLFAVGGCDKDALFNDLHVLDTLTWKWSHIITNNPLPGLYPIYISI